MQETKKTKKPWNILQKLLLIFFYDLEQCQTMILKQWRFDKHLNFFYINYHLIVVF